MRNFPICALVAVTAALAAASAGSAVATGSTRLAGPVAFHGSYSGTAATKQNGSVVTVLAKGTGTGTLLGASKVSGDGTGDSSNPPCIPFTGPGAFVGTGGTLKFAVVAGSTSCGDSANEHFTVSGVAKFAGGTGKYAKSKGPLKFTGTFTRSTGAFAVKFTGTLSL